MQYINTSIVIVFTYIIGLLIAIITKQINYFDLKQLTLIVTISTLFLVLMMLILLKFRTDMSVILAEIKKLRI